MICRFCGNIVMMSNCFCPNCGHRTGRGHGARIRKKAFINTHIGGVNIGIGIGTHGHCIHNHGLMHDHSIRHHSAFGRHGGMHGGMHGHCGFSHHPHGMHRPGGFGCGRGPRF